MEGRVYSKASSDITYTWVKRTLPSRTSIDKEQERRQAEAVAMVNSW